MKYRNRNIMSICLTILFSGLMSTSITYAETYTSAATWGSLGSGDGQFNNPNGLAIDSSGNVYVADTDNCRVQKFDKNGNYILKWGSYGNNKEEFNRPIGVAVDSSGYIYVADKDNNRIQKFNSKGKHITQWSSNVIGGRNDFSPHGIAVDSSGNVYVSDFNNSRILKFDSNGNYLMQWGSRGNRINEFNGPMDIAIDSSGNVYVVDANNNRIQKFSGKGEYLTQWAFSLILSGQFQYPSGIAVDSFGNVYVTNNGFNSIVRLYSNGNFTQFGSQGTGKGQLNYPLGLAVDSSGNVYVADSGNGRIQKFAIDDNATIEPVASFSYTVCFNKAPFIVYFYDKSTGTPTYWSWEFGDGDTSNQRNPIHVYNETGKYQVTLTVSNEAGRNIYTQAFTIPMSTKDGETIHTAQVQTPTVGQSQNTSMSTDKGTQTSTTEKTPWYQSPLFVAIVGGLFLIVSYEYQRLRERK